MNTHEEATYYAQSTLGLVWSETGGWYDAGGGKEPLAECDPEELEAEIEVWRGAPIGASPEAESDWEAFWDAVFWAQDRADKEDKAQEQAPALAAAEDRNKEALDRLHASPNFPDLRGADLRGAKLQNFWPDWTKLLVATNKEGEEEAK